mmetsp:Transcript_46177/g.76916  ORF Transcript_46177/g.76916 Transcript_46177/m.76916 type:complete len:937 (-) Transcript_46177:374-3184(-)|eukprot:CAMPEP_0184660400 /NCGR_PEP_ID=MMETSP0308-20130426/33733_1 /TAXON_ID=38269 /ORGANISM="Gloeochaete witrockiana, Strain SAG 46.84" /LENGTH=936 /DNA_ID=CAMNT_0027100947 /DNA_START=88 /DNA_END=2898 /DNA_ORIENTATION=+
MWKVLGGLGQITKDVLSDGGYEAEIAENEDILRPPPSISKPGEREEWYQQEIRELREKLISSESHVQNLSREYGKLLTEKEKELAAVKLDRDKSKEQLRSRPDLSGAEHVGISASNGGLDVQLQVAEEEIDRLSGLLVRAEEEMKKMRSSRPVDNHQVEELQRRLEREIDGRQKEVENLAHHFREQLKEQQAASAEQLNSAVKGYETEIASQQQIIQQLRGELEQVRSDFQGRDQQHFALERKLADEEERVRRLKEQLNLACSAPPPQPAASPSRSSPPPAPPKELVSGWHFLKEILSPIYPNLMADHHASPLTPELHLVEVVKGTVQHALNELEVLKDDRKELLEARKALTEVRGESQELREQVHDLRTQRQQLSGQLLEAQREREDHVKSVTEQGARALQAAHNDRARVDEELVALNAQLQTLTTDLHGAREQNVKLQQDSQTLRDAHTKLWEENERLRATLATAEAAARAEVGHGGASLERRQSLVYTGELQGETKVLRDEVRRLQDQLARTQSELDSMRIAATTTATDLTRLEEERARLESEASAQRAEVAVLQTKVLELQLHSTSNPIAIPIPIPTPTPNHIHDYHHDHDHSHGHDHSHDHDHHSSHNHHPNHTEDQFRVNSAATLDQDVGRLRDELREVTERLSKNMKTLEVLRLDLIDKDQQLEQYVAEAEDKDSIISDLRSQLSSLQATAGADGEVAGVEDMKQLQSEVDHLRAALALALAEKSRALEATGIRTPPPTEPSPQIRSSPSPVKGETINEQMQMQMQARLDSLEKENVELRAKCQEWSDSVTKLQQDLTAVRSELEEKLKEVGSLRRALEKMKGVGVGDDANQLVDRRLVNKLFVTYFDKDSKTRQDVLTLMARILMFTDEEKERVGLITPGWWSGSKKGQRSGQDSITEMWVDYLLRETDQDQDQGGDSAQVESKPKPP